MYLVSHKKNVLFMCSTKLHFNQLHIKWRVKLKKDIKFYSVITIHIEDAAQRYMKKHIYFERFFFL